jgi:hypothetical protein
MILKFWENILHLLNWNCLKSKTNPTMDLRGKIILNKKPEALSWTSFHELHYYYLLHNFFPCFLFAHIFSMNHLFSHIKTNFFLTHSSSSFSSRKTHKILFGKCEASLLTFHHPSLSLFSLSNGSLEIFPSNQWPLHRLWTNENRWLFFSPMEFRMRIFHAQWNTMKVPFFNQIGW